MMVAQTQYMQGEQRNGLKEHWNARTELNEKIKLKEMKERAKNYQISSLYN